MSPNNQLADRCEAFDPKLSPDNRVDELALHQDIVMATGVGSLTCEFDRTFVRSLDAAMTLIEGERPIVILHTAIDACGTEAQLFANRDEVFVQRLPLFVCAAALRARQS